MTNILSNQIAIVTGGSRGIGRAISLELASRGATIIVNYASNPTAAEETVATIIAEGGKAEGLCFDVATTSSVESAYEQILSKHNKLDILVNNAGISKDGLIVRLKDEDWEKTISINLFGTFACARAAMKPMMKARHGRIVNISSVVGEMGNAGQTPYCASKAGIIGFTKSLAREVASRNITVNAVTPGFVETDMTAALPEKTQEEHKKNIPLGRYGKASEVAKLVGFLAGPDAGYITGQVIGINGGMYM